MIGDANFAGSHMISVRNAEGSIVWEQVSPYGTGGDLGQVALMPDSGLLQAGIYDECDFFPDSRACRYAPDGTILWERIFSSFSDYPVTMVATRTMSHVAIASRDFVYILDLDGEMVGGFEVPSGNLQQMLWASDGTLFMVLGTDLKLADLQGTELAITTIGPNVRDMHWDGQQLFVLTNDGIRRFSPGLVPLGNNPMSGLDWNSRFVVSDSALYVNATTGLHQLAGDGSSTLLFPWPALPNLATNGCAVRNGTVLAVGNTDISGRSTGIIRTLSMDGIAPQHDQDVEVILQVDSIWLHNSTSYWDRRADITGHIVNHSSVTLHSIFLSMWIQVPSFICVQPMNRIDTAGFALAPGDTISLPFGAVDVARGLYPKQAVGTGEVCIVALAPDHLADRAPADNTACATVDFPLLVAGAARPAELLLAPNPADQWVTLSGARALGLPLSIRILDGTGRVVLERAVPDPDERTMLDVTSLPSGAYIVDAIGYRSRSTARLMVVRL